MRFGLTLLRPHHGHGARWTPSSYSKTGRSLAPATQVLAFKMEEARSGWRKTHRARQSQWSSSRYVCSSSSGILMMTSFTAILCMSAASSTTRYTESAILRGCALWSARTRSTPSTMRSPTSKGKNTSCLPFQDGTLECLATTAGRGAPRVFVVPGWKQADALSAAGKRPVRRPRVAVDAPNPIGL